MTLAADRRPAPDVAEPVLTLRVCRQGRGAWSLLAVGAGGGAAGELASGTRKEMVRLRRELARGLRYDYSHLSRLCDALRPRVPERLRPAERAGVS